MAVFTSIGDPAFPYRSKFMVLIAGKNCGKFPSSSQWVLGIDSEDYVSNFI